MIDLQTVLDEWSTDCEIPHNIEEASQSTPRLHAKYLQYYSVSKLQMKRAESKQKNLLKDKWLYYSGKMDTGTIVEKGWKPDPFDGLKVMKGDMDYWYDTDPDIQASVEKIEYHKTLTDTLKEIVDTLKWRHQHIRNILEWRRFEAGG